MIGTGHQDVVQILNVGGSDTIQFRVRRIQSFNGLSREPVDFSDLSDTTYENIRPGDLLAPGTYELDLIIDPVITNTQAAPDNYLTLFDAQRILESSNLDLTLHVVYANSANARGSSTGFISDSGGFTSELNQPREFTWTWQNTSQITLGTAP